jgi:hypothetical protein
MAYKTEELQQQAIDAIVKHNLIFIDEVVSFMDCSRSTFYERGLDKSDILKELILKNKNEMKAGLRKKWYESENPTVQIVLYKLIGTDDESDKINNQRIKHEFPEGITVKLTDGS